MAAKTAAAATMSKAMNVGIAHQARPNRPLGRTASVSNKMPKATAGDQEGP